MQYVIARMASWINKVKALCEPPLPKLRNVGNKGIHERAGVIT